MCYKATGYSSPPDRTPSHQAKTEELSTTHLSPWRIRGDSSSWKAIQSRLITCHSGLSPNTTYHYRCKASNINGTTYGTDSIFTTASTPIVTTGPAINIGDIGATLGGTVVTGGGLCYPGIQWGKTTSYGSATSFGSNLAGSGPIQVQRGAGPLEPSTTYHFRLVVYDGITTIYGEDRTFTTLPPFTLPNINITRVNYAGFGILDHQRPYVSSNFALVVASFNTGALPARLAFEYGTSPLYGSEAVSGQIFPALYPVDYMICAISGLTPNTTYHFRSRVTSDLGTVYSEDNTFTTLSPPAIITKDAALVTATDAVLRGSLDPKLWLYYPEFEFGTTPAFGFTPTLSLPSIVDGYQMGLPLDLAHNISACATQLQPETTYYYRLKAKTALSGEWQYHYGPVQSFTTLANGAPAFGYAVRTMKNNSVTLGDGILLTNITDAADLALAVSGAASSSSRGGSVTRGSAGVTYTPPANFIGLDTFAMTISDGFGTPHGGLITAIVGNGSESMDGATQLVMHGGIATLVFPGIAGASYAIQRSTDLLTWKTLQSVIAAENGMIPFTDPNSPSGSAYYRTSRD